MFSFFFFQAEDGIRDGHVTGVQTCALPICSVSFRHRKAPARVGAGFLLAAACTLGPAAALAAPPPSDEEEPTQGTEICDPNTLNPSGETIEVGDSFTLDGCGFDADAPLLVDVVDTSSDEASVNAPPATDGDGAFSATIGFDEPGEYVIQVSVNNGAGGQEQAVVTVEAQTGPEDPGDGGDGDGDDGEGNGGGDEGGDDGSGDDKGDDDGNDDNSGDDGNDDNSGDDDSDDGNGDDGSGAGGDDDSDDGNGGAGGEGNDGGGDVNEGDGSDNDNADNDGHENGNRQDGNRDSGNNSAGGPGDGAEGSNPGDVEGSDQTEDATPSPATDEPEPSDDGTTPPPEASGPAPASPAPASPDAAPQDLPSTEPQQPDAQQRMLARALLLGEALENVGSDEDSDAADRDDPSDGGGELADTGVDLSAGAGIAMLTIGAGDRKSTRLNSSHVASSYAV